MGQKKPIKRNARLHPSNVVKSHTDLVRRIAMSVRNRVPASVLYEDLVQAGMVGLLDAASHYDDSRGASFETYASIRVRGAMIDEVRRGDWAPRSVYRKAREVSEVVRIIENRTGYDAKAKDIAKAMGLTLREYHHILQDSKFCQLSDFEEPRNIGSMIMKNELCAYIPGPYETAEVDDTSDMLDREIAKLPDRERQVVNMYYKQNLNLKTIGKHMGVSESRISQMHTQSMKRLHARLLKLNV